MFKANDIWEGQKGDQRGGPKMAKNSMWVKTGHLSESGPKMAKNFGWGKFFNILGLLFGQKNVSNS